MCTSDIPALAEQVDQLIAEGRAHEVPAEQLQALVTAATRLYAAANEGAAQASDPLRDNASTTDAVVLTCALLKARDLNPFDLALWFSRSRVAG